MSIYDNLNIAVDKIPQEMTVYSSGWDLSRDDHLDIAGVTGYVPIHFSTYYLGNKDKTMAYSKERTISMPF